MRPNARGARAYGTRAMRQPMLALAIVFGCGAAAGSESSRATAGFLLAASVVLLGLAAACGRRVPALLALAAASLAAGAAAAVAARLEYEQASLVRWLGTEPEGPVRVRGVVHADSRERDDRTLLLIDLAELAGEPATGRARVAVGGSAPAPQLLQGEEVELWTTLGPPRGFRDPGVPDSRAAARREGWHASGYCKSSRLVTRLGPGRGILAWTGRLRHELRRRLVEHVPAGPEQAVVRAMVLGDRTGLEPDTEEAFRIAGTYHVLALSGAQIALVAGLLLWPLRYVLAPPVLRAVLVSGLLGGYSLLVGGDVPIVRAALMAAAVLVGDALDLAGETANLLGASALALLVARPGDWADVGFQLSFGATLGLVVLTPPIVAWLPRLPLRLELALATSLAAQLALLPLLALHFHRLAPAALLLNLAAVPLSTAVLLAGAAVIAASALADTLASGLGLLAFVAARALLLSGTLVEGMAFLDARVATPPVAWMLVHLAGLLCLASARTRWAVALLVAGGGAAAALQLAGPRGDGRFSVTVLDVGQGDGLVLRSPLGRTLLVDAGGSFDGRLDIGERVLGPYLWSQGVRRIDALVVTHAHPDHVGGVRFLIRAFDVGECWEGLAPRADRGYAELDRLLRQARLRRRALVRGDRLDWDGVRLEVLGPAAQAPPLATRNDDSLVLRVGFGAVSFLLAGDVEAAGEAALAPGRLAVLKVAHHGSRTSSGAGLLEETRPRVAVISAGFRNPFGHPHPEVLGRLAEVRALVFRTDREGAVRMTTDGHGLWVESQTVGPVRVQ